MNVIVKVISKIKLETMMTSTTRMAPMMTEMIVVIAIHLKKRKNTVGMTAIVAMTVIAVMIVPMVTIIAGVNVPVITMLAEVNVNVVIMMTNCQTMMMELL